MQKWFVAFALLMTCSGNSSAQFVWDGQEGHGGANWNKRKNWDTDTVPPSDGTADLIFAGTTETTNDATVNWDIRSLSFDNTAGAFVLQGPGNTVTIEAGGITHADNSLQTIQITTLATGADQTWQTTSTGNLSISSAVTLNNNLTLTAAPGTTITLSGAITGSGNLIKNGAGSVTLSGSTANSFSGTTTVNAGTLTLNKTAGTNAIASSSIVINGGTLLLGANNQIADTSNLTLNSGSFDTGGNSETLGTLTLSDNSTLELGSGASVIHFAGSNSIAWTGALSITNWNGNAAGGGTDQIYFGSSTAGLTATQLSQIQFVNPAGFAPGTYGAQILGSGEIVPVPEAGALLTAVLLGGFFFRRVYCPRKVDRSCTK